MIRSQKENCARSLTTEYSRLYIGVTVTQGEVGVATLRRRVEKSGNNSEPPIRGPARLLHENSEASRHANHTFHAGYRDIPGFCSPLQAFLSPQIIHSTAA